MRPECPCRIDERIGRHAACAGNPAGAPFHNVVNTGVSHSSRRWPPLADIERVAAQMPLPRIAATVVAMNDALWSSLSAGAARRKRIANLLPALRTTSAAPVAVHAWHDHRSARAVFLLVVGVADALGIRAGITRTAINPNAARCAPNDLAALRRKFVCREPMTTGLGVSRRRLRLRARWKSHDNQTCEEAQETGENGRSPCPHHESPSRTLSNRRAAKSPIRARASTAVSRARRHPRRSLISRPLGPGGQAF